MQAVSEEKHHRCLNQPLATSEVNAPETIEERLVARLMEWGNWGENTAAKRLDLTDLLT